MVWRQRPASTMECNTPAQGIKVLDEWKDAKGSDTFGIAHWRRCNSGELPLFSFVLRTMLTNFPNSCPADCLFAYIMQLLMTIRWCRLVTTLSCRCSRSTANEISTPTSVSNHVRIPCLCVHIYIYSGPKNEIVPWSVDPRHVHTACITTHMRVDCLVDCCYQ